MLICAIDVLFVECLVSLKHVGRLMMGIGSGRIIGIIPIVIEVVNKEFFVALIFLLKLAKVIRFIYKGWSPTLSSFYFLGLK